MNNQDIRISVGFELNPNLVQDRKEILRADLRRTPTRSLEDFVLEELAKLGLSVEALLNMRANR